MRTGAAGAARRDASARQTLAASRSWPQNVSHEPGMKIGEVVGLLKDSFPALSISKVRYLEAEGLISPHRVGNGYRQYSQADVERLRFALTAQRDEYLPISVIRERLAELDATGASSAPVARVVAANGRRLDDGPTDLDGLLERTGVSEEELDELIAIGLVAADAHGRFDSRAVRTVALALEVHALGMPLRNLRMLRTSAEREADVIDQAVQHKRSRSSSVGEEAAAELAGRVGELHTLLLRRAVDALV
ncbi:MerR family transcriptional regulator [Actinomyces sp. 187325]|uniref:transcriptional regulator FtsR n=2 Tax=Actinomyces TaxID=1654 RepID=UPI002017B455|nr:MerR family transcriptional regulator [Actinomyces sp. 187325]